MKRKAAPATTAVNNAGSRTHNEDSAPLPEKRAQDNHGNLQMGDMERVLNYIKENGPKLPQEIAQQFGCSHEAAYNMLRMLKDEGRLGFKQMRFYMKQASQFEFKSKLLYRKSPQISPFQEQSSGNFKEAGPQGDDISERSLGDYPELRKSAAEGDYEDFDQNKARTEAMAAGWEGIKNVLKKKGIGSLQLFKDGFEFHSDAHSRYDQYGDDMRAFREMLKDTVNPAPAAPAVSPEDQKVWKTLSSLMTVSCGPLDVPDLQWYKHSSKRICVRYSDTLDPEAWFKEGGENLQQAGLHSLAELVQWLQKQGIRERKKPKPYRSTPPLYD